MSIDISIEWHKIFVMVAQMFAAMACAGVIGFEREMKKRYAGLRTHMLVALGACIFMQVAMDLFFEHHGSVNGLADPTLIAQGVIQCIGFLGAGAIMHGHTQVTGLTTAASIWVAAGLGLAAGCGRFEIAVIGSLLSFFVLGSLRQVEKRLERLSTHHSSKHSGHDQHRDRQDNTVVSSDAPTHSKEG